MHAQIAKRCAHLIETSAKQEATLPLSLSAGSSQEQVKVLARISLVV